MYANTVINIHVGTDGDINVDTDALVERVSTTSAPIAPWQLLDGGRLLDLAGECCC